MLKPDCVSALQRKRLERAPEELRARLSLVRFESKNCGIAAISRGFQSNPGGFLCTSDLLVEREEFELPIEFLKPVRARPCGSCIPFCNNNIQSENGTKGGIGGISPVS
jgi:hypothetical protein